MQVQGSGFRVHGSAITWGSGYRFRVQGLEFMDQQLREGRGTGSGFRV